MTVIVNVSGYIENYVRNKGLAYDPGMLAETLLKYTPLIIVLPEFLPMEYAIVAALLIDIFTRTIAHLKGEPGVMPETSR